MNLFNLLDQAARRFPDQGALYDGARLLRRYGELRERALALAAGLRRRYPPGARVALASENQPAVIELFFAVWAAELVLVPLNAKLHPREMAQILDNAGAAALFASAKLAPDLAPLLAEAGLACDLLTIGRDDEALLEAPAAPPRDTAPDALAWLFYTSGTTGRSKGAMLSHRNLLSMTLQHLADIEPLHEGCSQIHAAPLSHGSGLYVLPSVARAARQVVPASGAFHPAEILDLCDLHPACGLFLAPTMVQRLRLEAEAAGRRPANLRCIVYGGGPMYLEEIRKALATFGPAFAQIYGQGEAPMTITGLRVADHEGADDTVLASVGWARCGVEVAVVDDTGRPLPPGETGEVVCRGDVVMSGYWNDPAATAQALRDGWLWTGDLGALDARGCLTLRDRSKDLVISGGSNIYPREVEEVLLRHPGVAEACVVGRPDPDWGEIVVAVIVPAPGADLTEAALDAHCRAQIARFKRPKAYRFVEALPKSNYGKVLKRELRDRLARGEL